MNLEGGCKRTKSNNEADNISLTRYNYETKRRFTRIRSEVILTTVSIRVLT